MFNPNSKNDTSCRIQRFLMKGFLVFDITIDGGHGSRRVAFNIFLLANLLSIETNCSEIRSNGLQLLRDANHTRPVYRHHLPCCVTGISTALNIISANQMPIDTQSAHSQRCIWLAHDRISVYVSTRYRHYLWKITGLNVKTQPAAYSKVVDFWCCREVVSKEGSFLVIFLDWC